MQKTAYCHRYACGRRRCNTRTLLAKGLTWLVIMAGFLHVQAAGQSQTITFSGRNVSLDSVFASIEQQTDFLFLYTESMIAVAKPVSIRVNAIPLEKFLKEVFKSQPLDYNIRGKSIFISIKAGTGRSNGSEIVHPSADTIINVHGRVIDEKGMPVARATITVATKGARQTTLTITNEQGEFGLSNIDERSTIIITSVGYEPLTLPLNGRNQVTVHLKTRSDVLDESVVIAYGTTTRRLNTGAVSKVTSDDIQKSPVVNPLQALTGRVPGMIVSQSSGVPGGGVVNIRIRGINSLAQGSTPLFIVDGVPYGNTNISNSVTTQVGALTTVNAFNSINSADIESVEVLKDADATAIYGSRGANGVILITTKKGKAGKTAFGLNVYSGAGKVSRTMDFLDTRQYLEMRREAFANDKITPTITNAPDLLLWDTTRYTNWQKVFTGGTAQTTDIQATVDGGNANTQFRLSAGYHKETTIYPGSFYDRRLSAGLNITHKSTNNRFGITLGITYSSELNLLPTLDLHSSLNLAPNHPDLLDSAGKLKWEEKGYRYTANPLSTLYQPHKAIIEPLIVNTRMHYQLFSALRLQVNAGYTRMQVEELTKNPTRSLNPLIGSSNSSQFSDAAIKTWIIEPQLEYASNIGRGQLKVLAGFTLQEDINDRTSLIVSNFPNDALMETPAGGTIIATIPGYSQYRYQAAFGRINYNLDNKYLVNLTGRRDGSSRFGPNKQYANFGAIGAAWIFSGEDFVRDALPFVHFGKLRISYGAAGSDQISDYGYLDNWNLNVTQYQPNIPVFNPAALFNPDYGWEINRKIEAAIELMFLQERIQFTAGYFRNRSDNQLINYALPSQTGFTNVRKNFPAEVQNTGVELQLNSINIKTKQFSWSSSVNLTLPRNKLLSFPGLDSSSYRNTYIIGEPILLRKMYNLLGVDPQTGMYTFNGTSAKDQVILGDRTPVLYGGFKNTWQYKSFELDVFFAFTIQKASNYWSNGNSGVPGAMVNQPVEIMNRWRQPGDITPYQRFTTSAGTAAGSLVTFYRNSQAGFSDASYARLKTVSLSWSLPQPWMQKIKAQGIQVFLQGHNLFMITSFNGDPEVATTSSIGLLTTVTAGARFNF